MLEDEKLEQKRNRVQLLRMVAVSVAAAGAAVGVVLYWRARRAPPRTARLRAFVSAARRAWEHPERIAKAERREVAKLVARTAALAAAKEVAKRAVGEAARRAEELPPLRVPVPVAERPVVH